MIDIHIYAHEEGEKRTKSSNGNNPYLQMIKAKLTPPTYMSLKLLEERGGWGRSVSFTNTQIISEENEVLIFEELT